MSNPVIPLLASLAVLGALFAPPVALARDSSADTDAYLRGEMARNHIPGAAVAVIQRGKLVKLQTYGIANLETGAAVSADSRFQIASATKLFTSVLLMDQVAQGHVRLDDPVSKYVAGLPASWAPITVRHLASHASGMAPVPPNAAITSLDDAVAAAVKAPLANPPGVTNAYGSDDFAILTAVLERASGLPYQQLLEARITRPLGLSATRFDNARLDPPHIVLTLDELPNRVATYEWIKGKQQRYAFLYPAYTYAAGGLFSSISDMAVFVQAVLDGRLVDDKLRAEMWTPVKLANGKPGGFATGWTVGSERGRRKVGHSGGPALADVAVYPEQDLAVIVLTNQRKLFPTLAPGVARLYLPATDFVGARAIADSKPELTARLSTVLTALASGQARAADFAPTARADLDEINEWLQLRVGGLPTMSRLELVRDAPGKRTYRARYGEDQGLLWVFKLDAQGLIEEVDVTDE